MKAAVILTKCKNDHALFGIRTEQREDGDWYATWAFKVNERTAEREKFGDTKISGNIYITTEYPSCPYCGAKGFFQCAECGKTKARPSASGAAMKPRPQPKRNSTR